jgi:4-hydroxy-tetrahydrodipicolinate synthase
MNTLIGTGVALVTPFKSDFSIDFEGLEKVVNHCIHGGVDYLVVLGTTAESVTLSENEKQQIIDKVVAVNNGRLPLVLGVGGNNTQKVVEELKTRDLSAFDAILSVSPYYNKPTQEGIYQHFKAVASASTKPVVLYNVPGRTSSNMHPKTVLRLARDFENIVAIKEAAGDIVQAMQLIRDKPKDFLVISGDDMITLPMILAGGAGVISVIGEGYPNEFSDMVRLGLNKKVDAAYELHYKLAPAIDLIFAEGNPAGIKAVFETLGICDATVRLPLVEASAELKQQIKEFTAHLS